MPEIEQKVILTLETGESQITLGGLKDKVSDLKKNLDSLEVGTEEYKGTLKELLQESERLEDRQSRYIQCILTDKHVPPRAMEKLRDVFGDSLVNVKREIRPGAGDPQERADGGGVLGQEEGAVSGPGLVEQFEQFYQEQTDELPDADQEAVLQKILEQQARRGEDYLLKMSDIPQEDSQELLETVLQGRRSAH